MPKFVLPPEISVSPRQINPLSPGLRNGKTCKSPASEKFKLCIWATCRAAFVGHSQLPHLYSSTSPCRRLILIYEQCVSVQYFVLPIVLRIYDVLRMHSLCPRFPSTDPPEIAGPKRRRRRALGQSRTYRKPSFMPQAGPPELP